MSSKPDRVLTLAQSSSVTLKVIVWSIGPDYIVALIAVIINSEFKMQAQNEDHWLPSSHHYAPAKELLDRIEKKLGEDKEISKERKENYTRVIREMNYTMGKCVGRWPQEVDKLVDNLKSILQEF